jgi:hypothetical protein
MRSLAVVIVVLVAIAAGAYFFFMSPLEEEKTHVLKEPVDAAPIVVAPVVESDPEITLQQQAIEYVDTLTELSVDPVPVEQADHFVRSDQSISLIPSNKIRAATIEDVLADPALKPDTPITIVKEVEQIETITPERLIAESGGDLSVKIKIVEDDIIREVTVREILAQHAANPEQPISVLRTVRHYELTTPRELEELSAIESGAIIGIVDQSYRLEFATIAELLAQERANDPDALFYVRTVRRGDEQGIWGILHHGLLENFARGMAIRRGEQVNTYQVEIPRDADEKLANSTSSFLGQMIHNKSQRSWVYNFQLDRMGQNPHEIYPGQEIIIVKFSPDELIDIYKYFARNDS